MRERRRTGSPRLDGGGEASGLKTRHPARRAASSDWTAFEQRRGTESLSVSEVALRVRALAELRKSRSRAELRSVHKRIADAFGELDARAIAPSMIEAWIEAQRAPPPRGDGLAENSIAKHVSFLSSILQHAVKIGAADHNAARLIDPGIKPHFSSKNGPAAAAEAMSLVEFARIVRAKELRFERLHLWRVCLYTGARFAEAAGFEWRDIEQAAPLRALVIRRQWSTKELAIIEQTKEKAIKRVPIHPDLEVFIDEAREWFRFRFARDPRPTDPLCPHPKPGRVAGRWRENIALRRWKLDTSRLGVAPPPGASSRIHRTRHTLVSALINGGAQESSAHAITHTASAGSGSAFGVYRHFSWEALCAAMMCLKLP